MIHELRGGETAALDATPLTRSYGTVDATPLFLCLMAEHAQWSGTLDLFDELSDAVEATLGWIDAYGDHDGDGLLDYRASHVDGLRNQGWRDSHDGVPDEYGVPLEPPMALIEPQAYAARAKRDIARLFAHAGQHARAAALSTSSSKSRHRARSTRQATVHVADPTTRPRTTSAGTALPFVRDDNLRDSVALDLCRASVRSKPSGAQSSPTTGVLRAAR